jgi:RimJ/RimL family protein N-acetyltransferase
VLRPDYPLKTERLLLRPLEERDLDDVFAYRSLAAVHTYLYREPSDRAGTAELLAEQIGRHQLTGEGQELVLAVVLPEAGRVIGEVGLTWQSEEHRQGEIGYLFHPDFHGRGYAREAGEVVVKLGFEGLGLRRVKATCDARNEPSWRLMERLGLRREAHFRQCEIFKGEWRDVFVYAMLAEECRKLM